MIHHNQQNDFTTPDITDNIYVQMLNIVNNLPIYLLRLT